MFDKPTQEKIVFAASLTSKFLDFYVFILLFIKVWWTLGSNPGNPKMFIDICRWILRGHFSPVQRSGRIGCKKKVVAHTLCVNGIAMATAPPALSSGGHQTCFNWRVGDDLMLSCEWTPPTPLWLRRAHRPDPPTSLWLIQEKVLESNKADSGSRDFVPHVLGGGNVFPVGGWGVAEPVLHFKVACRCIKTPPVFVFLSFF